MAFLKSYVARVQEYVQKLQHYVGRWWYPPLIGGLAAADLFLIVIPTDGILISSAMLTPKRWFVLALTLTVGSTFGGLLLAALVELQGLPWILSFYPNLTETSAWTYAMEFFGKYGVLTVFAVAATPFMQQPVIILASLASTPLLPLTGAMFAGRLIKFMIMAYLGSHAPQLLSRLWGVQEELREVGVDVRK